MTAATSKEACKQHCIPYLQPVFRLLMLSILVNALPEQPMLVPECKRQWHLTADGTSVVF